MRNAATKIANAYDTSIRTSAMAAPEFANLDSLHALRTRRFDDYRCSDVLSPLLSVYLRSYGDTPGLRPFDSAPDFCVTDP